MQNLETEIDELMQVIWESTLGLRIDRASTDSGLKDFDRSVTASILITGTWDGAVTIDCSQSMARQAASIMFDMPEEKNSPEDVYDAIGELINMIGGSVKSLLPGPSALSLPTVTEGNRIRHKIPGSHPKSQLAYTCGEQPLLVAISERQTAVGQPETGERK